VVIRVSIRSWSPSIVLSWLIAQCLKPTASCPATKTLDLLAQRTLVASQRQDVISLLVEDLLRDIALAPHGIDGHDRSLDRKHVQKLGDHDDLVGPFRHFDLAEHKPLTGGKGRDHVDRGLAARFVSGSAHRLAVNGDHSARHAAHRVHPGDKAALELL
jgi:hypothetical protein